VQPFMHHRSCSKIHLHLHHNCPIYCQGRLENSRKGELKWELT
jgi:hypothetical protein